MTTTRFPRQYLNMDLGHWAKKMIGKRVAGHAIGTEKGTNEVRVYIAFFLLATSDMIAVLLATLDKNAVLLFVLSYRPAFCLAVHH